MITLYVKAGCPYCYKVIEAFTENDIAFEAKDVSDETALAELMEKGGKSQTPFIVDGDVVLYESDTIIEHALGRVVTPGDGIKTDTETSSSGVCSI